MSKRLKEWTIHHIKHKNLFLKNLVKINDNEDNLDVEFKDKKVKYIIQENLEFGDIDKNQNICYVTLNNNKNFQYFLSEWKILVAFSKVRIIFVEKINNGKYWSIIPYTHDKISEKATLKQGLKALHESIKHD